MKAAAEQGLQLTASKSGSSRPATRSNSRSQSREVKQKPERSWKLCDDGWNCDTMEFLVPGKPGIAMVESATKATELYKTHKGFTGALAVIAPNYAQDVPKDHQSEIYFDAEELEGDMVKQQCMMRGILIQIGTTPAAQIAKLDPIVISKKTETTAVLAMEALFDKMDAKMKEELVGGRVRKFLAEYLNMHGHEQAAFDSWKQWWGKDSFTTLVRLSAPIARSIIEQSGKGGVFWQPLGKMKEQFAVIWLKGEASEDMAKAQAVATEYRAALMHKDGRFALRTKSEAADALRTKLGLLTGSIFVVRGLPRDSDHSQAQAICDSMKWQAKVIPERRKHHKGVIEYLARAGSPPPRDRVPVNLGYHRVMVTIEKQGAKETRQDEVDKEAKPVRSWRDVVAPGVKAVEPIPASHYDMGDQEADDDQMDDENNQEAEISDTEPLQPEASSVTWPARCRPIEKRKRSWADEVESDHVSRNELLASQEDLQAQMHAMKTELEHQMNVGMGKLQSQMQQLMTNQMQQMQSAILETMKTQMESFAAAQTPSL